MSAFESFEAPVAISDIATHAQLPVSTAHRLVSELVEWGALERNKNGGVYLGARLAALSRTALPSMRQLLLPHLEELQALTGHTVSIGLRDGEKVRVSERIYGADSAPRATRIGSRVPLHATAMGMTLLSHAPQWYQETYLARELEQPTAFTEVNPAALNQELRTIHAQGYALAAHQMLEGSESLAVPVFHLDHVACTLDLLRCYDPTNPIVQFVPAMKATARAMKIELDHFPSLPPWEAEPLKH